MIEIIVRGIPAPQGNHRASRHGQIYETSKAVGPWREAVRTETQIVMGMRVPDIQPPLFGPVKVRIRFALPRPQSHYGTGRNAGIIRPAMTYAQPGGRPDIDKLARAVLDGLTAGGAFKDDGQVIDLHVSKHYVLTGTAPGCTIEITEVAG